MSIWAELMDFVNHLCVDVHTVILYTDIEKDVFINKWCLSSVHGCFLWTVPFVMWVNLQIFAKSVTSNQLKKMLSNISN